MGFGSSQDPGDDQGRRPPTRTGKLMHSTAQAVIRMALFGVFAMNGIAVASAAERFVTSSQSSVDCSSVRPGDEIVLAAGERGSLAIEGCRGTEDDPIVIRNDADGNGPTVIRRESGQSGGFVFWCKSCSHVRIDGSTKWKGAPPGLTHGIKVTMGGGGSPTAFIQVNGRSSNLVIRNVEVDGRWPADSSNGIGIQINDHNIKAADNPGAWMENILLENNYVHDVEGEGMYVGPNWSDGDLPLRNIEIRRNVVENTGWDGIQLKAAIAGTNSIHHNVCRNVGINVDNTSEGNQFLGISIGHGTGDIHHNLVEGAGSSGISAYVFKLPISTGIGPFNWHIYANVVVKTRGSYGEGAGITVGSQDGSVKGTAFVYNNTVVDNRKGIDLNSNVLSGSVVSNNIIASSGSVSAPSAVTATNNRIGEISSMRFANASAGDFRLTADSPAKNAATGPHTSETDFDGVSRPQGHAVDQGAFEYVDGAFVPPPQPPVITGVN
jgi:hypothetical protein